MLRAFKYRMYPNKEQIVRFLEHFGACRYIYNWGLEYKIRTYKENSKSISRFALNKEITKLKQSESWLKKINSQSLQELLLTLIMLLLSFSGRKKGFLSSNQRKTKYNLSMFHRDIKWILKIAKYIFQRLDGLKPNFIDILEGNNRQLRFP